MTEHEAIDIATQFTDEHEIKHEGVERAFFVPVSFYEDEALPGMKDEWVVHFRPLPADDSEVGQLLSSDRVIIVTVDAETRQPSLMSTL
jgi:hypothetical protein